MNSLSHITTSFNKVLLFSVVLVSISQFNFGFEQQGYANIQAMDHFIQQFGVYNPKTKTYAIEAYFLSLFNSLQFIGFGIGILIGSEISARWGRRMCIFTMCIWAIVCTLIVVTSKTKEQLLAGRVLNYFYIGMELAVVPVYQGEVVPAKIRGFTVATYQLSLTLGGLIIALICRGTSTIDSNVSWQIPIALGVAIPLLVGSAVWFIPESPRWYLLHNKPEAAKASLIRLRKGRFTPAEIETEFATLELGIHEEYEKGSFWEMWTGINLKRTMIAIGTNFFFQATGQNFASNYGAIFFKSLNTVNPFNLTAGNSVAQVFVSIFSMICSDRMGRRWLLLIGTVIQIAGMMTLGALGLQTATYAIKCGTIAAVFIYVAGFTFGWAPVAHVITTEIPTGRLRDWTYRTASVVNIVIQFTVTFTLPYLMYEPYANLGSKVGFIFGAIAVLAFVFIYFCVPECKGRTLEEIDRLFHDRVPLRGFGKAVVTLERDAVEAHRQDIEEKAGGEQIIERVERVEDVEGAARV